MKILDRSPAPKDPSPREELIRMRNELLSEVASSFEAEKKKALRTKNYSGLKMFWGEIGRKLGVILTHYEKHWGGAQLATWQGDKVEYSQIDPFLGEFQRKLAEAFHTGNFNDIKNFLEEEKKKIEQMDAAQKGHSREYKPE